MQRILHDWCVYRLVMQYIVQMSASPFLASISSLGMSLVAAHKLQPPLLAAESEKPRQRVSNADRKVFANPESFCDKFIIA